MDPSAVCQHFAEMTDISKSLREYLALNGNVTEPEVHEEFVFYRRHPQVADQICVREASIDGLYADAQRTLARCA
ncbi:MAG: hypothetical protein ACNYPE_15460 [Candidatus Azotimanducaceae bacterium WSBS_2022_MAG_OTU7]